MASMAARVEIGEAHEAGVARSSRAGTKRRVKTGPTRRGWSGRSGLVPRIQTLRSPFFRRIVVMVALDTASRVRIASGARGMGDLLPLDQMLGMKPPSTRMTEPLT
jgi:hypothetical protein